MKILIAAMTIVCLNANRCAAAALAQNVDGVNFSSLLEQISAPGEINWSEGYQGTVYLCQCNDLTLSFSGDITTFEFQLKPNQFGLANFKIDLTDVFGARATSMYQIDGINDPAAIALKSTTRITSVEVKSADVLDEGFLLGEFHLTPRLPIASVPEPSYVIATAIAGGLLLLSKKALTSN